MIVFLFFNFFRLTVRSSSYVFDIFGGCLNIFYVFIDGLYIVFFMLYFIVFLFVLNGL